MIVDITQELHSFPLEYLRNFHRFSWNIYGYSTGILLEICMNIPRKFHDILCKFHRNPIKIMFCKNFSCKLQWEFSWIFHGITWFIDRYFANIAWIFSKYLHNFRLFPRNIYRYSTEISKNFQVLWKMSSVISMKILIKNFFNIEQ